MFVQIFVALVMMVVSSLLQAATTPKQKDSDPGKLDIPTAEEGREIPVAFGTNLAKDPNVIWSGDSKVTAIMSKGGKK